LGFACASLKRTLDRSNIVVRLRFAQANCVQNELGTFAWGSLRHRLSELSTVQNKNFEFQNPFSQTLQFWSSHTQNSSQMKFIGHVHKNIHQNAQNSWIKHYFAPIQNFTKLSKLFNNNNNFHHQFNNDILNIPIHQQHVSQTSTTTIIMKSFQVHQITTSSFTIFHKNTTYSYIWFLTHEFNINNTQSFNSHVQTYHQQLDMNSFIKFHISTYFQNHLIG